MPVKFYETNPSKPQYRPKYLDSSPRPQAALGQIVIQTQKSLISLGTERMLVEFPKAFSFSYRFQPKAKIGNVAAIKDFDRLIGSKKLAELKRDRRLSSRVIAISLHTLPHAIFACGLMFFVGQALLKVAVLVFIFHFSIDSIRCQIEMKVFGSGGLNFHKTFAYLIGKRNDAGKPDGKTLRTWFTINVIDQTAHVASLYAIAKLI